MELDTRITADEARRRFLKGALTAEDLAGDAELIAGFLLLIRQQFDQMQHQLAALSRQSFGRRSDTVDPRQLLLFEQQLDELLGKVHRQDQELRQAQQESAKGKVLQDRQVPKRQKLPDHLPRVERIHEVPEEERVCLECDQVCQKIGEETSELLGRLTINFVIRDVRIKYSCPQCTKGCR